jgi:hypothetical protein
MLSLKTRTALAMSPISSLFSVAGMAMVRSPSASSPITLVIDLTGIVMLRDTTKARPKPNKTLMPPATMAITMPRAKLSSASTVAAVAAAS